MTTLVTNPDINRLSKRQYHKLTRHHDSLVVKNGGEKLHVVLLADAGLTALAKRELQQRHENH